MTMTPTLDDVAVMICVYNAHSDLERTLDSIIEDAVVFVLIIDDGSTPPITPRPRLKVNIEVLRIPSNVGVERARAQGMNALSARGFRYAATIDAGDLARPRRIAKQRAFLADHPQVACVGTWTHVISRDGSTSFTLTPPSDPIKLRRTRFARTPLVNSSVMLDIERVIEVGNYRDQYPAAEDLDIFLRLMQHYDCANLPEIGVSYELNTSGVSATKRRRQIFSTLALQWHYFAPGNPYDWLGLAKNLLHLVIPYTLLQRIKRRLFAATA